MGDSSIFILSYLMAICMGRRWGFKPWGFEGSKVWVSVFFLVKVSWKEYEEAFDQGAWSSACGNLALPARFAGAEAIQNAGVKLSAEDFWVYQSPAIFWFFWSAPNHEFWWRTSTVEKFEVSNTGDLDRFGGCQPFFFHIFLYIFSPPKQVGQFRPCCFVRRGCGQGFAQRTSWAGGQFDGVLGGGRD